nr:hypothetical protein [Tanacetum cinerariifolium]
MEHFAMEFSDGGEDDVERENLADDIADVESDYVTEYNAYVESEDGEEDNVESGISCVEIGKDKGFKQL